MMSDVLDRAFDSRGPSIRVGKGSRIRPFFCRSGRPSNGWRQNTGMCRRFLSLSKKQDWLLVSSSHIYSGQKGLFWRFKAAGAWGWPLTSIQCI